MWTCGLGTVYNSIYNNDSIQIKLHQILDIDFKNNRTYFGLLTFERFAELHIGCQQYKYNIPTKELDFFLQFFSMDLTR